MPNADRTYTVSQIGNAISDYISGNADFRNICITGEVTEYGTKTYNNFGRTSVYYYFSIKEVLVNNGKMSTVLLKAVGRSMDIISLPEGGIEDGMKVKVHGDITAYPTGSNYQIWFDRVEDIGIGDEAIRLEQLKNRLEAEGLFRDDHKKSIPKHPKKICIITAGTGKAIGDMIAKINERCPQAEIINISTSVQGANAPDEIVEAIGNAENTGADVVIIGRGGGSPEHLKVFNDERIVRAVYACRIPIISAVGHKADKSLTDGVADFSAWTPTDAGEKAVSDNKVILNEHIRLFTEILAKYKNIANRKELALFTVKSSIEKNSPVHKIEMYSRGVDELKDRLSRSIRHIIDIREQAVMNVAPKINAGYKAVVEKKERDFQNINTRISPAYKAIVENKERVLVHITEAISLLNPLSILLRGYSVTYLDSGIVHSVEEVSAGDKIKVRVSDGIINATAESTDKLDKERK